MTRTRPLLVLLAAAAVATALPAAAGRSPAADPAAAPAAPAAAIATAPGVPATQVPAPTVTGPLPVRGDSYPFFATDMDLRRYGYVEKEYFIEGTARQFTAGTVTGETPYRTRIVVRRPAVPTRSSGTTVVEWYNITGTFDQEWDWWASGEYFMRAGITWVGVSAQYLSVTDLKRWNGSRYGSLEIASDEYAEDIYSQAAQALLAPAKGVDPLAGQRPRRLIASGHSQSGTKLAGYYNEVQALHGLFDGFTARGSEDLLKSVEVKVPALRVQSETGFTEGANPADVDTPFYRRWEVAGTSHVDWQNVRIRDALATRDRGSPTPVRCATRPYSRIPLNHVMNAAYAAMVRWLTTGRTPAAAPRFTLDAAGALARDARGNALGAIRLPQHEVATAKNTGDNAGVGLCILYGSHEPFTPDVLKALYPTRRAYLAAVDRSAAAAVRAGFLLPADAEQTRWEARHAELGLS